MHCWLRLNICHFRYFLYINILRNSSQKIGCPEGCSLRVWVYKRHPEDLLAKTLYLCYFPILRMSVYFSLRRWVWRSRWFPWTSATRRCARAEDAPTSWKQPISRFWSRPTARLSWAWPPTSWPSVSAPPGPSPTNPLNAKQEAVSTAENVSILLVEQVSGGYTCPYLEYVKDNLCIVFVDGS